jgi:hypothetical protein
LFHHLILASADRAYQWGTNISYWLNNSMPVGYQNQSTAFILGGDGITLDGHGHGTFDGNGDDWYRFIRAQPNTSNYPGRPHAITFNGLTNSVIQGVRFLRSQMWYALSSVQEEIRILT